MPLKTGLYTYLLTAYYVKICDIVFHVYLSSCTLKNMYLSIYLVLLAYIVVLKYNCKQCMHIQNKKIKPIITIS